MRRSERDRSASSVTLEHSAIYYHITTVVQQHKYIYISQCIHIITDGRVIVLTELCIFFFNCFFFCLIYLYIFIYLLLIHTIVMLQSIAVNSSLSESINDLYRRAEKDTLPPSLLPCSNGLNFPSLPSSHVTPMVHSCGVPPLQPQGDGIMPPSLVAKGLQKDTSP